MAILYQKNNLTIGAGTDRSIELTLPTEANKFKFTFDGSGNDGIFDNRDSSIELWFKAYINYDGSSDFNEVLLGGFMRGEPTCPPDKNDIPDCIGSGTVHSLNPEQGGIPRKILIDVWVVNPPAPPIKLNNYTVEWF